MSRIARVSQRRLRHVTILALIIGARISMSAQTIISTTGGGPPVGPFGKPDAQTFGQTFTAPTDNLLANFTFFLSPAGSLFFRAYVFGWDPTAGRATGSALFTSAPIIGPIGSGFLPVTAFPVIGGVNLIPGSTYVMFFSSSGQGTAGEIALQSNWDSPAADQYAGGAFVYLNNGENTGAWTSQTWSTNRQGVGSDIRFQATFVAAPEPSTFVFVATGLLAVVGFAWRGSRRRESSRDG